MPTRSAAALARVRKLCLSFPQTNERESHGAPSFFVGAKRWFAAFADNHHGDRRLALWCAAPAGVQTMLVEGAPDRYFVPAYVGSLGWVGVRLDRDTPWAEIAGVIEGAYLTRAPAKLAAAWQRARGT